MLFLCVLQLTLYLPVPDLVFSETNFLKRQPKEIKQIKRKRKGRQRKRYEKLKDGKHPSKHDHSPKGKQRNDDASSLESMERIITECRNAPLPMSITTLSSHDSISQMSSTNNTNSWQIASTCHDSSFTVDSHKDLENFWKNRKRNL